MAEKATTEEVTKEAAPQTEEAAPEEAAPEEESQDFQVGGPEQNFLPSGMPVEVAEQAYKDQQDRLEQYQATQQEPIPPEVPPEEG